MLLTLGKFISASRKTGDLQPPTNPPVNLIAPAISGGQYIGDTLNVLNGSWANSPGAFAYQWRRNGVNISGATGTSYVISVSDDNTDIDCLVTATNAIGGASADSNNIAATYPPPVNTAAPVASGSDIVGSVLSTTDGSWTNAPAISYQWRRGGVDISGANASTYTLVSADEGTNIDCLVTATNSGGSTSADTNDITVQVSSGAITGLKITVDGPSWVGLTDLGITTDGTGLDIIPSMTTSPTLLAIGSFSELSLGEYGTDSVYDNNDTRWNDNHWNDVGGTPNTLATHFTNNNSVPMVIYLKFATAVEIDKVKLRNQQNVSYQITSVTFEDDAGNPITPLVTPDLSGQNLIFEF